MESRWYYVDGTSAVGPFDWQGLTKLQSAGLVSESTWVWREGTAGWVTYCDASLARRPPPIPSIPIAGPPAPVTGLPADAEAPGHADGALPPPGPPPLASDIGAAPAPIDVRAPGHVVDGSGWHSRPVRPWRRCFARCLDTLLNGSIGAILAGYALNRFAPITADRAAGLLESGSLGRLVDAMLTALLAVPVGALMLGLSGVTIGKLIFGVSVVDRNLEPIGVGRALRRELRVCFAGLGLGVPIIAIICMIVARRKLGRDGSTSWDRADDLIVTYRSPNWTQYLLHVVGVALIVSLIAALRIS